MEPGRDCDVVMVEEGDGCGVVMAEPPSSATVVEEEEDGGCCRTNRSRVSCLPLLPLI